MAAIANTKVCQVRASLGQPDYALVLDVTTAVNIDLAELLAVAWQVGQSVVVDVQAAFANEDLKIQDKKCIFKMVLGPN